MSIFVTRNGNRLVIGSGVSESRLQKSLSTATAYNTIILMMPLEELKSVYALIDGTVNKGTQKLPLNNLEHRDAVEYVVNRLDANVTGKLFLLLNNHLDKLYWQCTAIPKISSLAPQLKVYKL